MTSKLSASQFNERLEYRTRYGDPVYLGPIAFLNLFFNQTTETFYGDFGSGWFELTNNNFNRAPFLVVGNYTENNNETSVNFEIRTNFYGFFWIHTITLLILILNLPYILLQEADAHKIINIVIVLIFLLRYVAIYYKKKELERDFLEIFEITN